MAQWDKQEWDRLIKEDAEIQKKRDELKVNTYRTDKALSKKHTELCFMKLPPEAYDEKHPQNIYLKKRDADIAAVLTKIKENWRQYDLRDQVFRKQQDDNFKARMSMVKAPSQDLKPPEPLKPAALLPITKANLNKEYDKFLKEKEELTEWFDDKVDEIERQYKGSQKEREMTKLRLERDKYAASIDRRIHDNRETYKHEVVEREVSDRKAQSAKLDDLRKRLEIVGEKLKAQQEPTKKQPPAVVVLPMVKGKTIHQSDLNQELYQKLLQEVIDITTRKGPLEAVEYLRNHKSLEARYILDEQQKSSRKAAMKKVVTKPAVKKSEQNAEPQKPASEARDEKMRLLREANELLKKAKRDHQPAKATAPEQATPQQKQSQPVVTAKKPSDGEEEEPDDRKITGHKALKINASRENELYATYNKVNEDNLVKRLRRGDLQTDEVLHLGRALLRGKYLEDSPTAIKRFLYHFHMRTRYKSPREPYEFLIEDGYAKNIQEVRAIQEKTNRSLAVFNLKLGGKVIKLPKSFDVFDEMQRYKVEFPMPLDARRAMSWYKEMLKQLNKEVSGRNITNLKSETSAKNNVNWYRNMLKQLNRDVTMKDILGLQHRAVDIQELFHGGMFMFKYDPKTKETLPYYDIYPLVIPVEKYDDGFLGLNLHYLSPAMRALLFRKLKKDFAAGSGPDKTFKLQYTMLRGLTKYKEFRPCLKRYLGAHVVSNYIKVPADAWDIAVFMPVESFRKVSKTAVWKFSEEKAYKKQEYGMNPDTKLFGDWKKDRAAYQAAKKKRDKKRKKK